MADIKLESVVKRYGRTQVVHGIDLEIAHNEFLVLVGPSGCGKSTILRMIAGLEEITGGEIMIGGNVVNDLPPRKRNISMVFQNYALYPHMNVRENLGFGLKIAKLPEDKVAERVDEAAEILGMSDLLDRIPAELSGGQRQRVAMGRAIVRHPDAFLFDEPLSNLDAKLRTQMRTEIKKLHQKVETTIVYVTHDQVEAMTLADRIVVIKDGRIEQMGTPMEVFSRPSNVFVGSFIGSPPMNLLPAAVRGGAIEIEGGMTIPLPPGRQVDAQEGQEIVLGIRPDDLTPVGHGISEGGPTFALKLEVDFAELLGMEAILYTRVGGREVQAKMFDPREISEGAVMEFNLSLSNLHLFDAGTQVSLERI